MLYKLTEFGKQSVVTLERMSRTIILLLAFTGIALAAPKDASRIIGGESASIQQYPFMANMLYGFWATNFQPWCGGTLVNGRSILSAAHCFYGDHPSQWRVRLGSDQANSGGVLYSVSNIGMHENYVNSILLNDIAIVRLSSNVPLSRSIGIARIAGPQYIVADNTRVFAAGFGHIRVGGPSSSILLHVGLDVINQATCVARYAFLKTQPGFAGWPDVTPEMLCTGILDVGGKDACQGDSGGPVVHQGDVLVGITSWGFQCADEFYPGVNVRVSSYTNWITSNA